MRVFIQFPTIYAKVRDDENDAWVQPNMLTEMRGAAMLLTTSDLVTTSPFTVRIGFYGLIIEAAKLSTIKACKRMLKHWGYID